MGIEIERKFLVKNDNWKQLAQGILYKQGYIPTKDGSTLRVRVIGDSGYLTLKGKTEGHSRLEYEYPIPVTEAEEILENLCQRPFIQKYRYTIPYDNLVWEVDEFLGDNQGLTIAEVELKKEDQEINYPDWVGKEVSGDNRYYNSNLVKNPFSQWLEKNIGT